MSEENKVANPLMGNGAQAPEPTNEATQAPVGTDVAPVAQVDTEADVQEEAPDNVPAPSVDPQPAPAAPAQETAHAPQAVAPTEDSKVKYENRVHRMKKVLQEQPQVQFMIPLGQGERKGAYDTVQINGYKMTIMKGAMVTLPQQVVDLLAAKYEVDMTAGNEFRVDGDEAKANALGA